MPNPTESNTTNAPLIIPQGRSTALIISNVQNDHINENNEHIIAVINTLRQSLQYTHTIFINHKYTPDHVSFIDRYIGTQNVRVGDSITTATGATQTLQHQHCLIGTIGQQIHQQTKRNADDIIVNIGLDRGEH